MRFDALANIREILKFLVTIVDFFHLAEPRPLPARATQQDARRLYTLAFHLSPLLQGRGIAGW